MAGTPAAVAGILMNTLGRASSSNSRRVSRMVASVSSAMSGGTSNETRPSTPPVRSHTGSMSAAAARMSSRASDSKIRRASRPWPASRRMSSS